MQFWLVNLIIPGAGVLLAGNLLLGTLLALLFAAAGNFVIWAIWLVPDSVAPWMTGVALAATAGSFVAAQLQLAQTLRRRHAALTVAERRRVLGLVCRHIDDGAYREALDALRPLAAARDDLLIAFRFAQVLTLARHVPEARAAWRHLRAIDLHHIYRDEIDSYERTLPEAAEDRSIAG